eukprot:2805483-Rhodomonas_salina.5
MASAPALQGLRAPTRQPPCQWVAQKAPALCAKTARTTPPTFPPLSPRPHHRCSTLTAPSTGWSSRALATRSR